MLRRLISWVLPIWRGDLSVMRATVLVSGVGATVLGTIGDAGMEAGLVAGGVGLILFAVSAAFLIGLALLTVVSVWRSARRHPGIGAGFAVAFAVLQGGLIFGDVGLATLAALGVMPSPLQLLTTMTARAITLSAPQQLQ